ncbi:MAG: prolipoprotein diacylglyceryl transferase [Candidatus Omnitrophota bacterium]
MYPILAKFGPVTVYSYGFMVAVGFGLAVYLASRRSSSFGIPRNDVIDLSVCVLLAGLIGARLTYVLTNLDYYRTNAAEIVWINRGGLVFYGGFLFGAAAAFVFLKLKKLSFWNVADLIAPYSALAHAIGRVGCFLNGCCKGAPADPGAFFAVSFPGDQIARYPAQIYSALALILIFVGLRARQANRRFEGEVFLLYCTAYPLFRFFIEFARNEPALAAGLTFSQAASVVVIAAAAAALLIMRKRCKNSLSR